MKEFTIWAETWDEAELAADTLDQNMDEYGTGNNAFRVAVMPDIQCPYDTCYLTDEGAAQIIQAFIVT